MQLAETLPQPSSMPPPKLDAPCKEERAAVEAFPETILLLGTDAAGKNHVARVWMRRMEALGLEPRMQESWLVSPAVDGEAEEKKSALSHLAEAVFLAVFPWIAGFLPLALRFLIRRDARRFRSDGQRRLIVSHSALRILAFTLGARGQGIDALSESTRSAIRELCESSRARVIVLDVDHAVRQQRIEARLERGDSDPFDRYMLADPVRSERIEACLVSIATELMDAHLVVNNDLDDDALWAELERAR